MAHAINGSLFIQYNKHLEADSHLICTCYPSNLMLQYYPIPAHNTRRSLNALVWLLAKTCSG